MAEWVSYETATEPSLDVSIDVDLADNAQFRGTHPYAVTIRVTGFPTDEDGRPTDVAGETLYELETRVEAALAENDAALACTWSGDGAFTLLGYASHSSAQSALQRAASSASYRAEVRSDVDTSWSAYQAHAISGEALEEARDHQQLVDLEESGEDLTEPRPIDFAISFPDDRSAHRALNALAEAGFDVPDPDFLDDANVYDATLTLVASEESLKQARLRLDAVIIPLGGRYLGWSS